jgi:hypothetical protein
MDGRYRRALCYACLDASTFNPSRLLRQRRGGTSPLLAGAVPQMQPWRRQTCMAGSGRGVALVTPPREPATPHRRPSCRVLGGRPSSWCAAQNAPVFTFPRTPPDAPATVRRLLTPLAPSWQQPLSGTALAGTQNMPPVPGEALREPFGPAAPSWCGTRPPSTSPPNRRV